MQISIATIISWPPPQLGLFCTEPFPPQSLTTASAAVAAAASGLEGFRLARSPHDLFIYPTFRPIRFTYGLVDNSFFIFTIVCQREWKLTAAFHSRRSFQQV